MSSKWCEHQFSELCDITRGASPRPIKNFISKDGMPWVKIADATGSNSRYIESTNEKIKLEGVSKSKTVFPGDLILSNSATPGLPKFMGIEACIHDGWMLLRNFRGLNKRFAYWLLIYERKNLVQQGNGSVFTNLKTDILKNHVVKIPSEAEQEKIADCLDSIQSKIELVTQTNQTLEQIAQAIFKSWFVDFEPVKAKIAVLEAGGTAEQAELAAMSVISGKDETALKQLQAEHPDQYAELAQTAALFPSAMVESELGEIPEGWEVVVFSEIATLDTTSVKPNKSPDKVWDHFSIPAFDVNQSPAKELGATIKSGKYKVKKTAILSSKLNPHFPRTWWPDIEDEESAICSTEFMQFIPKKDEDRPFIYCLITSSPFQEGILQRVTGTTGSRQRAQPPQVAAMDVIIPRKELIDKFSNKAFPLLDRKAKNIKQNNSLSDLRDTLLPKLLSGEIDLSQLQVAVEQEGK